MMMPHHHHDDTSPRAALGEVEWCLRRMIALDVASGESLSELICQSEEQAERRLTAAMRVIVILLRTAIEKSSHQEMLLKATLAESACTTACL